MVIYPRTQNIYHMHPVSMSLPDINFDISQTLSLSAFYYGMIAPTFPASRHDIHPRTNGAGYILVEPLVCDDPVDWLIQL